jgi:hypothetical protein
MTAIQKYRSLLWPVAFATCGIVVSLSLIFSYLSGGPEWWRTWISIPLFPFLPIILGAFLYAVTRVRGALNRYETEADACEFVTRAVTTFHDPAEIQTKLRPVLHGENAIGKRLSLAFDSGDLDTAWSVLQVPQPMDVEEDKTFGELHFWRSALVLLGLLSTVIFFAKAFTSAGTTSDFKDLAFLVTDLQRALTMTMAGIATSVVLGGMATRLFDIQQNLKLRVDELTALMLPRLLPRYEKGTKEEPGPALLVEKLQDFLREVEEWKTGLGVDVTQLTSVLREHREILAKLPAVGLPKSFAKLDSTLSNVATVISETKDVNSQALKILSEDRNINVDNVLKLLLEVRLDAERIKGSQTTLLDTVIPKQTKALEELTQLNTTFNTLADSLHNASQGLKEASGKHEELIKTNKAIQSELSRLSQPSDVRIVSKLDELLTGIKNVQTQGSKTNEGLERVASSITSLASVLNSRPPRTEEMYVRPAPHSGSDRPKQEPFLKSSPSARKPMFEESPRPKQPPKMPIKEGHINAEENTRRTGSNDGSLTGRFRNWWNRR